MSQPNTSNLKAVGFSAADSYVGVLGTNVVDPQQGGGGTSREKLLFAATQNGTEADTSGSVTTDIVVPSGTSIFMGGIGNWQTGEIADCWLQVQKPNGDYVNVATSPAATGHAVLLPTQSAPANSVMAFVLTNPEAGTWRVTIGNSSSAMAFQAMVSTVPQSTNSYQTPVSVMDNTIYGLATTPGAWDKTSNVSRATESWDWECDACKVASYGLALIITAAVTGVSAAIFTAESAAVLATAGFLGITAPAALALIVGLVTGGTIAVDFVLTSLCTWAGACS